MADLTDVANALVNVCVAAIYPLGTSQPPAGGVQAKIYQGWPEPAALAADLAAQIANVTVFPSAQEKITTRRLPDWQVLVAPAPTLTATVTALGKTITIGGTVSIPQAVALVIDGVDYAYAVQVADTLTTIAASLAALVSANQAASSALGVITVPNAHTMGAQIVASGTSGSEVALEARTFTISVWADCFDRREPLAKLLTPALAGLNRIAMPDGSTATCEYAGSLQVDTEQKQGIFRRDIKLTIEYATIATRTDTTIGVIVLHRMLSFNGTPVSIGNVVIDSAIPVSGGGGSSTVPVNTVAPSISGAMTVGSVLTALPGTWTGSPAPTYGYVWKRGGTAISGATSSTYTLVTGDIGATITCTVTATNTAGNASATTPAVGPVTSGGYSLVATASSVGSKTAPATTAAINTTGANLIVVGLSYVTVGTLSDSKSNVWTPLTLRGMAGGFCSLQLFYCYSPIVGAGHAFSYSGGDTMTVGAMAFSGAAAAPFDVESGFGNNAISPTIQPGTLTPAQNKELVCGMVAWNNGGTTSIDSGLTKTSEIANAANINLGNAMFYSVQGALVAVNPTITLSPAASFAGAAFAAFKAA